MLSKNNITFAYHKQAKKPSKYRKFAFRCYFWDDGRGSLFRCTFGNLLSQMKRGRAGIWGQLKSLLLYTQIQNVLGKKKPIEVGGHKQLKHHL